MVWLNNLPHVRKVLKEWLQNATNKLIKSQAIPQVIDEIYNGKCVQEIASDQCEVGTLLWNFVVILH